MLATLFYISAFADKASMTAINLLDKNGLYFSDSDIIKFLKTFNGDTITFNFPDINYTDMFTKENPDTIWIKKRPKKNPKEGKHYHLSYAYEGEHYVDGEFRTPVSRINGKSFGVLSVDNVKNNHHHSYHEDILLKLIDLEDLSIINCKVPHDNKYSFEIRSNKFDRDIRTLTGTDFYIKNGNGDTCDNTEFIPCSLSGGDYSILFDKYVGDMAIKANVTLNFVNTDGIAVPFKYEKPHYSGNNTTPVIISKEEYEDNYAIKEINSDIDFDLINSGTELPFDFVLIHGRPIGYTAKMSQRIVPDKITSNSWTSDYKYAPKDEFMFVGGSITVRDTKFLKMTYNGKAFFMKADDVRLEKDEQLKLDSLEQCSPQVKELFWNKCLNGSRLIYLRELNDAIDQIKALSKYGLAIESWGVYDESEYTEGTGLRITFLNPTEQVIKYISMTLQGYNAVDDPYGPSVTRKCIGPVEPYMSASYEFEYVWFTDIVEYAKLRSITVTYKNGTTKTIRNPSQIELSPLVIETLSKSNPVEDFN